MAFIQLMAEEEEISVWSEFPTCLMEVISDRLITNGDYTRFGTVCNSWRSVFLDNIESRRPPPQLPLLMIPLIHDNVIDGSCNVGTTMASKSCINDCYSDDKEEKEEGDKAAHCKKVTSCKYERSLYSMTEQKVYKFSVPVPDNVYCFGSSHGWLTTVAMDDDSYPVRLLNPFLPINNNEIELPSLRAMPIESSTPLAHYAYADKFVVSSDPAAAAIGTTTCDRYTVMAIGGKCHELLAWKPGDEAWTPVEIEDKLKGIDDFIHYKDRFYAVTWRGELVVTVDNNSKAVFYAPPPPDTEQYYAKKYIVEASGDLYQVQRDVDDSYEDKKHHFTFNFEVFKLLDHERTEPGEDDVKMERSWKEVDTLDGHAFFIGNNASMSVLASDFPGCKPNCIYFCDDRMQSFRLDVFKPKDIGVYSLVDDIIDCNFDGKESFVWPNPIWIEPTICRGSRS